MIEQVALPDGSKLGPFESIADAEAEIAPELRGEAVVKFDDGEELRIWRFAESSTDE
jgi:hypothetical protein